MRSDMNKIIKVGLLSTIAVTQALTLVGGFFAYRQMSKTLWELQVAYKELFEETHGGIIDFGLTPNPFAPLVPLALLGLFLTLVLIADQLSHKKSRK
jgi:hypothetical protein